MLEEAVLPATIMEESKEFIADWISTLEIENTAPWMPVGMPTLSMRNSLCFTMRRRRSFSP